MDGVQTGHQPDGQDPREQVPRPEQDADDAHSAGQGLQLPGAAHGLEVLHLPLYSVSIQFTTLQYKCFIYHFTI